MPKPDVIVVTGASSGIGAAVVESCLADGARVLAVSRSETRLQRRWRGRPGVTTFAADLSQAAAAKAVVAEARKLGRLRAVVHSAGAFAPAPVAKFKLADWDEMFDLNVRAAALLLQAALKDLNKGGVFIGISSTAGMRPVSGYSAYCASKGALNAFVESAALELAPQGIRVHAVAPGIVETPMQPNAAKTGSMHPLGRAGKPADVAKAVRFLLSADADWAAGVILPIDGGIHLV